MRHRCIHPVLQRHSVVSNVWPPSRWNDVVIRHYCSRHGGKKIVRNGRLSESLQGLRACETSRVNRNNPICTLESVLTNATTKHARSIDGKAGINGGGFYAL